MKRTKARIISLTYLIPVSICALSIAFNAACSTDKSRATKAVEDYLKNHGATKVQSDLFYKSNDFPAKAYTSVTVTYNFADSKGLPQQEYLGFILSTETGEWKIQTTTGYTTETTKAHNFLAGKK